MVHTAGYSTDGGGEGGGDLPTNMWGDRATFTSRNSYFEVKTAISASKTAILR